MVRETSNNARMPIVSGFFEGTFECPDGMFRTMGMPSADIPSGHSRMPFPRVSRPFPGRGLIRPNQVRQSIERRQDRLMDRQGETTRGKLFWTDLDFGINLAFTRARTHARTRPHANPGFPTRGKPLPHMWYVTKRYALGKNARPFQKWTFEFIMENDPQGSSINAKTPITETISFFQFNYFKFGKFIFVLACTCACACARMI